MKAITFDEIGTLADDLDALRLRTIPVPEPKNGEVLIRMKTASINPGDFLFIQNLYPEPKKPVFPGQIAGNHGAGIIERMGSGVPESTGLAPGMLVAFSYFNTWAEYAAVPYEYLMPLPQTYPPEKAAQFFNLITAWDLVDLAGAQRGDWLVITAGNASVSVMALQIAVARGIRVISVVRRRQDTVNLLSLGAEAIIELSTLDASEDVTTRIQAITSGARLSGVIDNVGGPVTGELLRLLGINGQLIINGGMSPDKFALHNFDILLNVVTIKPYVYRYFFRPPSLKELKQHDAIIALTENPEFVVPIAGVHPLEDFKAALSDTLHHGERGKHIFTIV